MTTISFGPLKTLALGALLVAALSSNINAVSQTRQLPRELDFAYYSLRDGFLSSLSLVNNSPTALSFAVTIFSRSGQSVVGPTTDLPPQANTSVDLSSILQAASIDATGDFSEGSVAVHYTGNGFKPLVGQLVISNAATGAAFTSEMFQNQGGSANGPPALNFMWWEFDRGETARIAVTNISGSPVVADIVLEFNGRHRPGSVLYFSAHQTMVLLMSDILDSLGETSGSAPQGGITIVPRGPGSPLIATGLLSNPITESATPLPVAHPDRQFVSAQHAIGIPVGVPSPDSPYVGLGTFEPHVVLRNLAAAPQNVTLTVEYPGNEGTQQLVLLPFPVEANNTKDVSLASALPQLPAPLPFASVRIQYDGAPDSLMGQVESREQQGRLVVSSPLVNEGDGQAGAGAHPWQVDHGTNSFLFLTNMGEKPSRIGFQVQAKGVNYYLTNLTLQPHETRAIGMRELRDQQQEDFQKNKIPADATEGSVRWVRLDNVPVMGRLVVLKGQEHEIVSLGKRAGGTASGSGQAPPTPVNFICLDCFCNCPAGLQSLGYDAGCDVLNVISGQICGISFLGNYADCNGNSSFFDDTLFSILSLSDTSVATISNSTDPASLTGVGPGTADLIAAFTDNSYPFAPNSCSPLLHTVRVVPRVIVKPKVAFVGGNRFMFVGNDSSLTNANSQSVQGTPPGGQYAWSSSKTSISFQPYPNIPEITILTAPSSAVSSSLLDTTITVTYTLNQQTSAPASKAITVRKFKFVTNQSPTVLQQSNGYTAYAIYTIYTSPSGQKLEEGLRDISVEESVSTQSATLNGTPLTQAQFNAISFGQGPGATDDHSQFKDDLSFTTQSGTALLSGLVITQAQDLLVTGCFVRHNTLQYTSSTVTLTNGGPTN
ncbi:MAG: hypothetical protein LAO31_06930 [Acidobacteriia bacterium]|nr:hypothetical protein [Terriglobia bacterium]